MTPLAQLRSWLRAVLHRSRMESEMDAEMHFHVEARADDLVRSGLSHDHALRQARLEFGGFDAQKEDCRQSLGLRFWDELRGDLRYALRNMRRNPGFSLLAILCLTVGIGANAAAFSWIEGTLLRPYPAVADQHRLLVLAGTSRGTPEFDDVSWPDFLDLQSRCTLIEAFIAEKITGASLNIGDRAEWAIGSIVSANYFDALGIHPALGRGFAPAENVGRNAHPVAVISYQFWKDRFHSDPRVVGKTQVFNGLPHTIVGVAPEGFYGTFVGYAWQFWVPVSMQERFDSTGYMLEDRSARWIEGFVRLKPGVTRAQAQAEISSVAHQLESEYPASNRGRGIRLFPLWQSPFNGSTRVLPVLGITVAVVFFVLLIACANVSNLMLVRAFARRHEITVRMAVGARRRRLLKQLLTEGLVLSMVATAGGLLMAHWCRNLLALFMPSASTIPVYVPGEIDWRVVALSAGVCVLATLLFGLVPAMQSSKLDVADALKGEAGGVVGPRGRSRVRSSLVLVQVALSFVLLVCAGLLVKSLQRIRIASPGFSTDVLNTPINLFGAGYDTARAKNFQNQLLDRVQSLIGVQSAAYARITPFSYRTYHSGVVAVDGYQPPPDEQPTVEYNEIGPGYLATMGIPLVSGREFTRADDEKGAPVAVVNETMASQYWRGDDPVGKRLQINGRALRVIGVAKNAKYQSMTEAALPFFYVPLRQNFSTQVALNIRTTQNAGTVATELAREIHAFDPDIPVYRVITLREQVNLMNASQRVAVMLLGGFGGLALLLAVVGLYGVMSYAVSQSTRELGLRMALGAGPRDLLRLVMANGFKLVVAGVLVGVAAALVLTRLLGYMLYQVSPRDPLAFALAMVLMLIASLTACFLPAWRATRTDPIQALRI